MVIRDEVQENAAVSDAKTILIRGGPGTGKTFVLAQRLSYLAIEKEIPLSSILFLTFSSASAEQFRRLLESRIENYDELWIHTFHSFAEKVINCCRWDLPQPIFISPFKEYLIVKEILRREQPRLLSHFRMVADKDGFARELSDLFKLLKQNLLEPEGFHNAAGKLTVELSDLTHLYAVFESVLKQKNYSSFSDTVIRAIHLFKSDSRLRNEYNHQFKHILIDEFEEIDPAQLELLKVLFNDDTSLFIAGDEAQRIFSFRGSGLGRFDFMRSLRHEAQEYNLQTNFRLPETVRAAANRLVAQRLPGAPHAGDEVSSLAVVRYKDPIEQAYAIAREIKRIIARSKNEGPRFSYSDFAVLCRSTTTSSLPFQEAFSFYEIPYCLCNSANFYGHSTIRFLVDLIKFLASSDDDAVFMRVLHIPAFALDPIELKRILNYACGLGCENLYEATKKISSTPEEYVVFERHEMEKLSEALKYLDDLQTKVKCKEPALLVIKSIMQTLFYKQILHKELEKGVEEARNLNVFSRILQDMEDILAEQRGNSFSAISELLENAFAQFPNQEGKHLSDEMGEGVRILTIHQTKGLQFPFIYFVDVNDENFPAFDKKINILGTESIEKLTRVLKRKYSSSSFSSPFFGFLLSPHEYLREERQLFYVAATRTSRYLTITFTEESTLSEPVEPSPFIKELTGEDGQIIDGEPPAACDDVAGLLNAALNREEVEGILRSHVCRNEKEEPAEQLRTKVSALGLDVEFVCSRRLFKPEPPEPLQIASHTFSSSQLSLYLSCPRRFFYERMLRLAPEDRGEFAFGSLIHAVLEEFHKKVRSYKKDGSELERQLLSIFQKIWCGEGDMSRTSFENSFPTALQRAAVEQKAKEILRIYLQTELANAADTQVVACEEDLKFEVQGLPFRARIDRIDVLPGVNAGHRIIDYKTAANGPMSSAGIKKRFLNMDADADYMPEDFQMPLYLLGCRAAGFDPKELIYYWVAQHYKGGEFKRSSLIVGSEEECLMPEEIDAAEKGIVAVAKKILSGDFPRKPRSTYDCQRCAYLQVCEE